MTAQMLLIAASAHADITAAALAAPDTETGGLLVGCRVAYNGQTFALTLHATGPGPAADQSYDMFAPDVAALQTQLDTLVAAAAAQGVVVTYQGEWHKHPADYAVLSNNDIAQGRRILDDPSYVLPQGELILPIVTVQADAVRVQPYLLTRSPAPPVALDMQVWDDAVLLALIREHEEA